MSKPITVDLEELKKAGIDIESTTDLITMLREGAGTASGNEKIENAAEDVTAQLKAANAKIAELETKATITEEAEAYEEASKSSLVKNFADLSEADKKSLFEQLSAEHGTGLAKTLLMPDSFVKSVILEPIAPSAPQAHDRKELRRLHDKIVIALGCRNAVEYKGDMLGVKVDREVLKSTLETFGKYGDFDKGIVDMYSKGLNEALDTQTQYQGSEFLPTILSADYIDAIFLASPVAGQFRRINMPSKTYDIPMVTSRGRIYGVPESLAYNDLYTNKFTPNQANTDKLSLTAKKLGYQAFYSDELTEDSIVNIVNMLDVDLQRSFSEGLDDVAINGSTATNDLDNAGGGGNELWTSTSDVRNQFNGIRKSVAGLGNYVDGSTLSVSVFNSARALLDKYAINPRDMFIAVPPTVYYKLLVLNEVETADLHGQDRATIRNGVLGSLYGIDIVVSDEIYTNLNASGVYDNATTSKTVALVVNRLMKIWGDRRMLTVERDRMVTSQQNVVVGHWRGALVDQYPGEDMGAVVRNIAS